MVFKKYGRKIPMTHEEYNRLVEETNKKVKDEKNDYVPIVIG